ncbi:hypothetical protein [Flavobacterium sp. MMS24-S5]|uniref:hypothetical protein n=1 Tax=Flavobacterium sp. MMS24-S5 TaxID=3416605 RepID=UPI003D011669
MKKLLLVLLVILCSCESNKKEKSKSNHEPKQELNLKVDPYFVAIKTNDVKLAEPVFGDWLYSRKEKGRLLSSLLKQNMLFRLKKKILFICSL